MRRFLVLLGGLALLALLLLPATGQAQSGSGSGSGDPARGRQRFLQECSTCHGPNAGGTKSGPSLLGADVGGQAAVDWVLRSGRMPAPAANSKPWQRQRPKLSERDIVDIVAYAGTLLPGPKVPQVPQDIDPSKGDLVRGRVLFGDNCSGCHGMSGAGAATGQGWNAPALNVPGVDAKVVAQAMLIGPAIMPIFAGPGWDKQSYNDVGKYIDSLHEAENPGGAPIGRKGPVPEGFVAWILGIGGLILVVRLIGGTK